MSDPTPTRTPTPTRRSTTDGIITMRLALPLAILVRPPGASDSFRRVLWLVGASGAGFAVAHALHFAQVAWFYGSPSLAFQDLGSRALYRSTGGSGQSRLGLTFAASLAYARMLWFLPNPVEPLLKNSPPFGAILPLLSLLVLVPGGWVPPATQGRAAKDHWSRSPWGRGVIALGVSYGIAWIWVLVMPSHARIHLHMVPRLFFLSYFVAVLHLVTRLFGRLPESGGSRPSPDSGRIAR